MHLYSALETWWFCWFFVHNLSPSCKALTPPLCLHGYYYPINPAFPVCSSIPNVCSEDTIEFYAIPLMLARVHSEKTRMTWGGGILAILHYNKIECINCAGLLRALRKLTCVVNWQKQVVECSASQICLTKEICLPGASSRLGIPWNKRWEVLL